MEQFQTDGTFSLRNAAVRSPKSFFWFNRITPKDLIEGLNEGIERIAKDWPSEAEILHLGVIFPEIKRVKDNVLESAHDKLRMPEAKLQDLIRHGFRKIGASPIPFRAKDSPNEIADIEFFRVRIGKRLTSFAVVVKGFNSIPGKRLSWEDISHQVTKAQMLGKPDHVMVISAKEPKDTVVTYLTMYGQAVENPNLVVFVPPRELLRFILSSEHS